MREAGDGTDNVQEVHQDTRAPLLSQTRNKALNIQIIYGISFPYLSFSCYSNIRNTHYVAISQQSSTQTQKALHILSLIEDKTNHNPTMLQDLH